MQGKKDYQEKLFAQFQLSDRVPKNNFYRRLKEVLDLHYLYKLTKKYYGEGRRIFRMAPLHHHFELKGWPESKITVRFCIIAFILSLCALMTLKIKH